MMYSDRLIVPKTQKVLQCDVFWRQYVGDGISWMWVPDVLPASGLGHMTLPAPMKHLVSNNARQQN
eukprot:1870348-Amphidinium_carterae.1